jgi:hypothetical protein
LAELALDDEKNTNKGQVQGKGKSKGKKKKQYYKKAQDSKVWITGFVLFPFIVAIVDLYMHNLLLIYNSCIVGNRWW